MTEHGSNAPDALEGNTLETGWLAKAHSEEQSSALDVRERFSHRRLGEILVMMGLLDQSDIDNVLEQQEKSGLLFGQCCLHFKLISERELSQALALQFGFPNLPVSGPAPFDKDLALVADPFSPYSEALRSISRKLLARWLRADRKILPIISTEAAEGRSHVAANLAISFAETKHRTLLVDADFRNPRQHEIFNVPQHPGLSRLLCGFAPKDVLHNFANLKYFALIPSGPLPPNPSELLGRGELMTFLNEAREHYDVVVVDTPAADVFPDAEMIASAAGSALIIARKNQTRQKTLHKVARGLQESGVDIAGTIMNDF